VAPIDRYRTLGDLPSRIPVFPLRGAILLPRSELPLNVFEPRYLAMVEDALVGHRILGIIQPGETGMGVESPTGKDVALKRVGCAGRITAFQELPDGRLRMALTGIARFAILREEATDKPYRTVVPDFAAFAADLQEDASVARVDRAELTRVLKAYLAMRNLDADWTAIARAPLEPLVNGLAAMSPFGPEEKQALLEAATLEHRARVLIALAEMAIAAGDAAGGGGTMQ
jgi:hypothetical protein